ncbi:MAG: GlsB/YeaQ/YmgE family stress response membrane protein, partial [Vicinamibacterales bacterium]
ALSLAASPAPSVRVAHSLRSFAWMRSERPGSPTHPWTDGRVLAFAGREEIGGATMGILAWILFGLVVGIIAKLLMPGRDPGGFIITILLGIAGALLGGFLGQSMGWYRDGESAGWIVSILGAILLLALYRMLVRRRA